MLTDADIVELDKLIYYYVAAGWPRYTDRSPPHPTWTEEMSRVQSEAIRRHRVRHIEAMGGSAQAPKSKQPTVDVAELVKTL